MKTNIKWILIFAAVCICCAAILKSRSHPAYTAKIIKNGEVIRTIDLSDVDTPYEFDVSDENGKNTIRVEKGKIAVTDADCPDKICVKQGFISNGAVPIVCLPHKLSVEITGTSEIDAVAGGN